MLFMGAKFAHLINPVNFPATSSLYFAQQVTLRSIEAAALYLDDQIPVEFITSQYAEDRHVIPDLFSPSPDLTRSILDIAVFSNPRKLPILGDLLDRAYSYSDAEYIIYTNIDIAIQPHFYKSLTCLIDDTCPAATITRRTISRSYRHIQDLPRMYAEVGRPHRGWDTFVFPRSWIPQLELGTTCLGAPLVGLVLFANLTCIDRMFCELTNLHLTFHLGNDRRWSSPANLEYLEHNRQQAVLILRSLEEKYGRFTANSPPGRYLFFHRIPVIGRLYDLFTSRLYLPPTLTRRQR